MSSDLQGVYSRNRELGKYPGNVSYVMMKCYEALLTDLWYFMKKILPRGTWRCVMRGNAGSYLYDSYFRKKILLVDMAISKKYEGRKVIKEIILIG